MSAELPLYLFAKAPDAARVKTRLQPRLSAAQCADLARQMLQHTVQTAAQHWPGRLVLCVAPHPAAIDTAIDTAAWRADLDIIAQAPGDLGWRMQVVLQQGIARAGAAAVMGCDVPQIDAAILRTAYTLLAAGQNVVGPATDGGFYLLGLQQMPPPLFKHLAWGSATVYAGLCQRAAQLGVCFQTLTALRDIDRWPDLQWLAEYDSNYARFVALARKF